jgi:hypothetical protein
MKNGQYKVSNHSNVTTCANHHGWPIKNMHFLLLAVLEGSVYWDYLQAQSEFHLLAIVHPKYGVKSILLMWVEMF